VHGNRYGERARTAVHDDGGFFMSVTLDGVERSMGSIVISGQCFLRSCLEIPTKRPNDRVMRTDETERQADLLSTDCLT